MGKEKLRRIGVPILVTAITIGAYSAGHKWGRLVGLEKGREDMKHATASYLLNHAAVHRNANSKEDSIRANELESRAQVITNSNSEEFVRENSNQSVEAIRAYGHGL